MRARRPGEFHAAFRRMPTPQGPARQNEPPASVSEVALVYMVSKRFSSPERIRASTLYVYYIYI